MTSSTGVQRREYLDRMRGQIGTLGALIDDLFELSRLEAGDIGWTIEQVPLAGLVDETVAAMRLQADAKRVTVSTRLPEQLAPARANPEKLQRVLFNLIQNAIRHTPPDGSVVVRAQPADAGVEIEVADTGEGIPPADRERVFTAFYRAAPTALAPATAPGSGWRSRGRSSRPTGAGSGSRTRSGARACASTCRWGCRRGRQPARVIGPGSEPGVGASAAGRRGLSPGSGPQRRASVYQSGAESSAST